MAHVFTRLLLATERTEFDVGAERVALALAQACQLPLAVVLPLVSNPEYEALLPQLAARAEQAAAVQIAQLRAQADLAGVTLALQVRRGEEPYREIVDEARALRSELLIIRRRGKRSFLAQLLVGEMVSKVVAHAPCPVLIVPHQARLWQQRLLAAVEIGTRGCRVADTATALALTCGLPLQLVCVLEDPLQRATAQTWLAERLQAARTAGVAAQGELATGKPAAAILACASRCGADLIVLGRGGDTTAGRALVGSVAQKVMGLSEHPVLVVHD